ncbi:Lar family restriction alleviation protein [Alistipes sp.]|uniref:Lar family restriction alleviation protein n=1 Tax=Alistipes sp. TaxID=1872444 RepID=UPI003995AEC8
MFAEMATKRTATRTGGYIFAARPRAGAMWRRRRMNNLKPCPFCGSKAVLAESVNTQTFRVECINSGCYCYNTLVCFSDKNRAIEAWNRRVENG